MTRRDRPSNQSAVEACTGSTDTAGEQAAGSATTTSSATTAPTAEASSVDTTDADPAEADDESVTTEGDGAPAGDRPPRGTGTLTIDGVEYPFTVDECSNEPQTITQTGAIVTFSMKGQTEAEGREVTVSASRIELAGRVNDTFAYVYADDPNDYTTSVIVGTGGSSGEQFLVEGETFSAGPLPFQRTEGISVVDGVDPGRGSIHFTC